MSDREQLLLVIVVIYLTDCVFWASRRAVGFRDSFLAGAFAVLHPSTYLGHDRGGIVWRNPLPPFGTTMTCPARPVSVTPEHAYAYTAASALFGGRPEHPERIVALDEVKSVTVDPKDILVNGNDRSGRRGGLAMMRLVPPTAIRACDGWPGDCSGWPSAQSPDALRRLCMAPATLRHLLVRLPRNDHARRPCHPAHVACILDHRLPGASCVPGAVRGSHRVCRPKGERNLPMEVPSPRELPEGLSPRDGPAVCRPCRPGHNVRWRVLVWTRTT
jgi:hypothetical protein